MRYGLTRLPLSEHCDVKAMHDAGVESMWVNTSIPTKLLDKATEIRYTVRECGDIMRFSITLMMPRGKNKEILDVPVCDIDEEFVPFSITRNDREDGRSLIYFTGYCVALEDAHVLCGQVMETDDTWKAPNSMERPNTVDRWSRAYNVPASAECTSRFGSEYRYNRGVA